MNKELYEIELHIKDSQKKDNINIIFFSDNKDLFHNSYTEFLVAVDDAEKLKFKDADACKFAIFKLKHEKEIEEFINSIDVELDFGTNGRYIDDLDNLDPREAWDFENKTKEKALEELKKYGIYSFIDIEELSDEDENKYTKFLETIIEHF